MKTLIQNVSRWLWPLAHLLLLAGLIFSLGSCTDEEPSPSPVIPVEVDPVTKYTGYYELMETVCPSTDQSLEIRPYIQAGDSNFYDYQQEAKMIYISNLGKMTNVDVTAVWNDHVFVIERQEVSLNDSELSTISGELRLYGDDELSVFYAIHSPEAYHSCAAEYKKY